MKRFCLAIIFFLVPVTAIILSGCGGGDETDKPKPRSERKGGGGGGSERKASGDDSQKGGSSGALAALETKGTATVKGKATFDGTPPKPESFKKRIQEQGDRSHCLKGPTDDPTWMIGPNKEVRNVVVWLRAPRGKFFKIPADQQKLQEVVLHQPFCAFDPHVATIFPSFFDSDTKSQKKTGQVFKAINDAPKIQHNTAWTGNSQFNSGQNLTLKPGGELVIDAKPCEKNRTGEDLIKIHCDIHKWMSAYAWAFDHPYAAVTKEDGTYEIKNVPAGAEVQLMYWHESMSTPKKLDDLTLKEGETAEKDIKISK
jgi:hypothetical protein